MNNQERKSVIDSLAFPFFATFAVPVFIFLLGIDSAFALAGFIGWLAYWLLGALLWHPMLLLWSVVTEEPTGQPDPSNVNLAIWWAVALPFIVVGAIGMTILRLIVPEAEDDSRDEHDNDPR